MRKNVCKNGENPSSQKKYYNFGTDKYIYIKIWYDNFKVISYVM